MRARTWTGAVLAGFFAQAGPGWAIVEYQRGPGLNLSIPDDGYNGTLASMRCDNLVIADGGSVVTLALRVGISHTFVGDLTIKLRGPDLTLVTVVSLPGFLESADDGTGPAGDESNLVATSQVTFRQSASVSAESMGSTINSLEAVCQDDGICQFIPNHGSALSGDLSSFTGKAIAGTWTFCVGDSATSDQGVLDRWVLVLTTTLLFSDGFEKGDFCAWSVVVGGTTSCF